MNDEERELRKALAAANGAPGRAALILGVHRQTVWRRMKKYGISVERRVVKNAA